MKEINAKDFFHLWVEIVEKRKEELYEIWNNPKAYTWYIKGSENSVVDEIAHKLDLMAYPQDYYSVDTVFYKKEDLIPDSKPNQYWLKDIRIAFEHENNFDSGLYQEVSHLLLLNCDLKVLVTYPPSNKSPRKMLDELHKLITSSRNSTLNSIKEDFLLIFCNEDTFEWTGYIYNENEWVKLVKTDIKNPILDRLEINKKLLFNDLSKQLNLIQQIKSDLNKLQKYESSAKFRDIEKLIEESSNKLSKTIKIE